MDDRELIEYLDENALVHYDIGFKCGGCLHNFSFSTQESVDEHMLQNPTPTLEWMLERLVKHRNYSVAFYGEECAISSTTSKVGFYRANGTTRTLALRGAVEKMMEAEK